MTGQERRAATSAAFGVLAVVLCGGAFTASAVAAAKWPASVMNVVLCILGCVGGSVLYLTFATARGWWPIARLAEDPGSRFESEQKFHEQLKTMAETLASENGRQANILLARGEVPVPWEISARDRGTNVNDLCLQFALMSVPQMIILGEAGTGKSTMITLLAARLFDLRDPAEPKLCRLPVRISVATWTPMTGTLQEWTLARLAEDYPSLLPCLDEISRLGFSESLMNQWLIPMFDGFDEIKRRERPEFLRTLARDFAHHPMILTSRVEEYVDSKSTAGAPADAIEVSMKPVKDDDAQSYLARATQSSADSWNAVFGSSHAELRHALANPLLLWLLAEVYSGTEDEPRDLLALTEAGSIESHLLRSLVPSAFGRSVGTGGPPRGRPAVRVSGERALAYLAWLASRLARRDAMAICWWQLQELTPRIRVILGTAVAGGATVRFFAGITPVVTFLTAAFILGAWFGFGFGRGYSLARMSGTMPSDRIGFGGRKEGSDPDLRSHLCRLGGAHLGTAAFWITAQITGWQSSATALRQGGVLHQLYQPTILGTLAGVSLACAAVAFVGGHLLGLSLRSLGGPDIRQTAARSVTPRQSLRRDAWNTLKVAPIGYIMSATAMIAVFYPVLHWHRLLMELITAAASIITYSFVFPTWPRYRVAHLVLVARGILPLFFVRFLEDAHYLGLLRQTGLSYKFRHESLRASLADLQYKRVSVRREGRTAQGEAIRTEAN